MLLEVGHDSVLRYILADDTHTVRVALGLVQLQEYVLLRDQEQLGESGDQGSTLRLSLRGKIHGQDGHAQTAPVLDQHIHVAIVDDSSRRGHIHSAYPVVVGHGHVLVAREYLKKPQAKTQHREKQHGHQRQQAQPQTHGRVVRGGPLLSHRFQVHERDLPEGGVGGFAAAKEAQPGDGQKHGHGEETVQESGRQYLHAKHGEERSLRAHDELEDPVCRL